MKEAIFDPIGDARRQRELLKLIPEPDEAFHRAAREPTLSTSALYGWLVAVSAAATSIGP
jgi:hypothetical protein